MKRFGYFGSDGMREIADGEWIRYTDHCEAMKRIAGAPIVMEQSKERDAAFEEWIYSQRADVDPYEVWHAACEWQSKMRAALSAGEAQQGNDWRDQVAALIDIYDDGMNNPPESRCYVEGAFEQQIAEARALLSALTPPRQIVADSAMTVAIRALEQLAAVPGCGCSFPCRCGGEEWTRMELEGRMDIAAEALAEIKRVGMVADRVAEGGKMVADSAGGASKEYRRGLMEAFHYVNMMNANRRGRTAEETCSYIVRELASFANSGQQTSKESGE